MVSTAFVLGAGLGTRLRPLSNVRPKPLIPVCNRPLIAYAFDRLIAHGATHFVVNTHWLAEGFAAEFPDARYGGCTIDFRHEAPEILETAGGLKNAEDVLRGGTFIVYNGDILCDTSLEPLLAAHAAHGNEVTLCLRSSGGPLEIAFDSERGRVTDIGRRLSAQSASQYLFTGIYVVSPRFLDRIPSGKKVSVIPFFLEMIAGGAKLGGVVCDDGNWWDLGTREKYMVVHRHFAASPETIGRAPWIGGDTEIASGVAIDGATAIGSRARIGVGAELRDCIVWPGAEVAAGSHLDSCVITGAVPVAGSHQNADL